jgi:outer membrane lipoprotein
MKRLGVLLSFWLLAGCSAISPQLRATALPEIPLAILSGEAERFRDMTVVLGGYLLEVSPVTDHTRLTVLQAPLGFGDEPGRRDASQGRFVARFPGFLDPEVYSRERKVTIAGRIAGTVAVEIDATPRRLLLVEGQEIHLWLPPPLYIYSPCLGCDPYDDDPFYRPLWHRRHYPYDHRPFHDRQRYWRAPHRSPPDPYR